MGGAGEVRSGRREGGKKEEREAGQKGTILGNAKFMVSGSSKQEEPGDLPF